MIKCALQTNTIQIKHNKVRIPTGGRLTSWLFTRPGGVEFGATEDKYIQWQGGALEPRTSGIQVQHSTTRPRSPPILSKQACYCVGDMPKNVPKMYNSKCPSYVFVLTF